MDVKGVMHRIPVVLWYDQGVPYRDIWRHFSQNTASKKET